jgi:FKBP-type peptidyl-prolyl cis-trans isomerase FklB
MRKLSNAVLGMLLLAGVCFAGEAPPALDTEEGINYSLGYQVGHDLKQQGLQISPETITQGVGDALSGVEPQLSKEEMDGILLELKKDIVNQQQKVRKSSRRQAKKEYRDEGLQFLAENAGKEGVVSLASGVQYQIIKNGTGKRPGPHDRVKVNYRGTRLDGHEFGSSYRENQPSEIKVDGVIAGLTEALQLMQEGAEWQVFIPSNLAYGERGPLADRTVIFDIELISIEPPE